MTRELDLKNPGGIEREPGVTWKGQAPVQPDPTLVAFIDFAHGVRACVITLQNYSVVDHLSTLKQAITRWAPPRENDTAAYIADMCQRLACAPSDPFVPLIPKMLRPLFDHENGAVAAAVITDSDISSGIALAQP